MGKPSIAGSLIAPLLIGCASLRPSPLPVATPEVRAARAIAPDAECASLDAQHRTWGTLAAGAGAMSGLGGFAAGADTRADPNLRLSVGVGALVVAGVAAAAVYESNDLAAEYTRRCGGEHGLK